MDAARDNFLAEFPRTHAGAPLLARALARALVRASGKWVANEALAEYARAAPESPGVLASRIRGVSTLRGVKARLLRAGSCGLTRGAGHAPQTADLLLRAAVVGALCINPGARAKAIACEAALTEAPPAWAILADAVSEIAAACAFAVPDRAAHRILVLSYIAKTVAPALAASPEISTERSKNPAFGHIVLHVLRLSESSGDAAADLAMAIAMAGAE